MTERKNASMYLADQLGNYNLCFLDNHMKFFRFCKKLGSCRESGKHTE